MSVKPATVASLLHRTLSSAKSEELLRKVEVQDWVAVANMSCDPRCYSSAYSYLIDVIPAKMLKKVADFPVEIDRLTPTIKKWKEAEAFCYKTNQRLYRFLGNPVHYEDSDKRVQAFIGLVRKIIEDWVGRAPPHTYEGSFGPGSTLTDRGHRATVAHKMQKVPSCTPQYEQAGFRQFVGTMWHHNMVDAGLTPSVQQGEEYFTVEKDATILRGAGLQPSINGYFQRGLGIELLRRWKNSTGWRLGPSATFLKDLRAGWNLKTAQGVHRKVAERASVDRSFCTIDLSSASDTVASNLVRLLLPAKWFLEMESLRTHRITFTGKNAEVFRALSGMEGTDDCTVLLEKFSSMGNGFTFELESIIFAALACAITRLHGYMGEPGFDVFVFGDDIIMRDELYSEMEACLLFFGFNVNAGKSFHGPHGFRESCGADFFDGVDVRPMHITQLNDLEPERVIGITNAVYRTLGKLEPYELELYRGLWFHFIELLPKGVAACRGPDWLGDSVIHDVRKDRWITRSRDGRTEIKCVMGDPSGSFLPWYRFDPATVLACAVLRRGDGLRGILPRNPKLRLKTDWVTLSCD